MRLYLFALIGLISCSNLEIPTEKAKDVGIPELGTQWNNDNKSESSSGMSFSGIESEDKESLQVDSFRSEYNQDEYDEYLIPFQLFSSEPVDIWEFISVSNEAEVATSELPEAPSSTWMDRLAINFALVFGYSKPPNDPRILPGDVDLKSISARIGCKESELSELNSEHLKLVEDGIFDLDDFDLMSKLSSLPDQGLFKVFAHYKLAGLFKNALTPDLVEKISFAIVKANDVNLFVSYAIAFDLCLSGPKLMEFAAYAGSDTIIEHIMEHRDSKAYYWGPVSTEVEPGTVEPSEIDTSPVEPREIDTSLVEPSEIDTSLAELQNFQVRRALSKGLVIASSVGRQSTVDLLRGLGADPAFDNYGAFLEVVDKADIIMPNLELITDMSRFISASISSKNLDRLSIVLKLLNYPDLSEFLLDAILTANSKIVELVIVHTRHSAIVDVHLKTAAQTGNTELFVQIFELVADEIAENAVQNCIITENLRTFLNPSILSLSRRDKVQMLGKLLSYALSIKNDECAIELLKVNSVDGVKYFPLLLSTIQWASFALLEAIYKAYPSPRYLPPKKVGPLVRAVFESSIWNAVKFLAACHFNDPDFPQTDFVSRLYLTDQVETASILAGYNVQFSKTILSSVKDKAMRDFLAATIRQQKL